MPPSTGASPPPTPAPNSTISTRSLSPHNHCGHVLVGHLSQSSPLVSRCGILRVFPRRSDCRRCPMVRPQQIPLRPLTDHERTTLEQVARSGAERADRVARAKELLAVADGATFTAAARAAG